jgi:hypothetical protein
VITFTGVRHAGNGRKEAISLGSMVATARLAAMLRAVAGDGQGRDGGQERGPAPVGPGSPGSTVTGEPPGTAITKRRWRSSRPALPRAAAQRTSAPAEGASKLTMSARMSMQAPKSDAVQGP